MTTDEQRERTTASDHLGTPLPSGDDRQAFVDQLRAVNEKLVVSAMQAQTMADQADASRAEAETANRLKDESLAVVSHELRTPLSAVLGWVRLLASGQLEPGTTIRAVDTIERNAKALARIIDDLLDISRLLGGGVRIERKPVDLIAVIQGALDEVQPAAAARSLEPRFTCADGPPYLVAGDALRLQQVVANLLSNAIKFTPAGGHIELRLSAAGSDALIKVSDTGQGISPDFLPHVFDRFAQAEGSTTRRQGGIGLGLAIVRALVERHGGTVQAESPGPGQGASFTLKIPMGRRSDPGEAPDAAPARRSARAELGGLRILAVEDDPDGRDMLALLLQAAGANVVAVRSARVALQALDVTRPDVIMTDIGMPGEDGYALVRQLRARESGRGSAIPVVALTGYVRPEDRDRILTAGFQAYIRKPIDVDELVDTLASLAVSGGT